MSKTATIGLGALSLSLIVMVALPIERPSSRLVVSTAAVTSGMILREVVATGRVEPVATVEVGTRVSGVVESLAADFNSPVHAGQIVARLDPSWYRAQLEAGRAALVEMHADVPGFEAEVADAQAKLARGESLAVRHAIADADLEQLRATLDEARAGLDAGKAEVNRLTAAVHQAGLDISHTFIRSPADGVVIDRRIEVGQSVAAPTPALFRIATDLHEVQLTLDVDESDLAALAAGDAAVFAVDGHPRQVYHATVAAVVGQPGPVNHSAILHVRNDREELLPGMTAVATIDGSRRDHAVRIPNRALAFRPTADVLRALGEAVPSAGASGDAADLRQVWKYDGQHLIPIAVHAGLSDEEWTEAVSGSIEPGDTLVTAVSFKG